MYRDGNSGTICWHCGLPGDKKFYRLYPKSGPNTKSHEVIQIAIHEIYGHNYIEANATKDDIVCPECRNSIMNFTKCYKKLFGIKRYLLKKVTISGRKDHYLQHHQCLQLSGPWKRSRLLLLDPFQCRLVDDHVSVVLFQNMLNVELPYLLEEFPFNPKLGFGM